MKNFLFTILTTALLSSSAVAGSDTKETLTALKQKLSSYGAATIEGTEKMGSWNLPVLYFGKKKINNNFDAVDDVKKSHGGTATVFVKQADEFIRVSTNVLKDDGTRAAGTMLAHNKAYQAVVKGETFCGEVEILGSSYDTCYEPIKDSAGKTIGLYYVGYKK